ncbi:sarcosine oxidase subunit gamma family protein [Rhizobium jaguaris]|uniref:sarcosine oxidase subunit gamma n=1 Tax=Rhizobium jaguaris TaxID=1312183 RepID=UPI0039BEEE4F
MRDRPEHRPALAGKTVFEGSGIRLETLPEGHLLHVMGSIDTKILAGYLSGTDLAESSLRPAGFRQWFVVGDDKLAPARIAALSSILQGNAFVSDQSNGRVRIGLSGPLAAETLAKGTAVDLDPSVFPEGHSVVTLFGHVSLHLTRTGLERFELTVLRSYAEHLHEELEHLAAAA